MIMRAGVATVLALLASLVFARGTFREFDRIRIPLSEPRTSDTGTELSIEAPDLSAVEGPLVALIDFESDGPRTFTVRFDEMLLGNFAVSDRRQRVAMVIAGRRPGDGHTLRIRSDSSGWTVARAQLSNVRGFSNGLFNTVVVPATTHFERPPVVAALVVMIVSVAAAWRTRAWRLMLETKIDIALATVSAIVLLTVIAAPYVSRYRILVAFHTWLTLIALPCLPSLARVAREWPKLPIPTIGKWFVILLTALAATSVPRWVGDGNEYLDMTSAFRDARWPDVDAGHFWLYSAVATPFVATTDVLMFGQAAGFALVNGLLLAWACVVVARRHSLAVVVLIFVGPVIWWLDKVHADVFLFALLTLAIAWIEEKPGRSLLALGAAAAQNPAIAPLLAIAMPVTMGRRRSLVFDVPFLMCAAGAIALALLNPLYYVARIGRPFPLLPENRPLWPTSTEFLAFLIDPNIGLFTNAPLLAVGVLLSVWYTRRSLITANRLFAVAAAVTLLFAFTQATNVNHGGTPGMSRYALWLIPLMIPLLQESTAQPHAARRRAMLTVGVLSAAWCLVLFHPARRENFLHPTRLAGLLWTRYPTASNPVPEIFIERLQHHERMWTVPIATDGCEKALIGSSDGRDPTWPPQCDPRPVPDVCRQAGAVCYANRTNEGFSFTRVTYWPYPAPTKGDGTR